jgi:hypothetical protein
MSPTEKIAYAEDQLEQIRKGIKPTDLGAELIGRINHNKTLLSISRKKDRNYTLIELCTLNSETCQN